MGSREFCEWAAFNALEPIGPERADVNAGIIAAVIANANRDPKSRPEPFEPRDFMPDYAGELARPRQSDEEIAVRLRQALMQFKPKEK